MFGKTSHSNNERNAKPINIVRQHLQIYLVTTSAMLITGEAEESSWSRLTAGRDGEERRGTHGTHLPSSPGGGYSQGPTWPAREERTSKAAAEEVSKPAEQPVAQVSS